MTNAEVLGNDVVEGTMANLGRMAMGKSVKGAAMGGILGTVASDSLKGAIKAGKSSRNVGVDEGYKFGDVSRGIVRGLSTAAEIGASSRGGDGNEYVPGDLTVGVAKATGEYVGNNKGKLASAGGSGIGSMVGLAVAGPLGFVAGSYFGSRAGKSITGDDVAKKGESELLLVFIKSIFNSFSFTNRQSDVKLIKETDRAEILDPRSALQYHQHSIPGKVYYGQKNETIARVNSNGMETNLSLNQSDRGISKGNVSDTPTDDVFGIFATPISHERKSISRSEPSDPFTQLHQPQVSHQHQKINDYHSFEQANPPRYQPNRKESAQFRQEQMNSRQQLHDHRMVQQTAQFQHQSHYDLNAGFPQYEEGHQQVNSRQQQSQYQSHHDVNTGIPQYKHGHQQVNYHQQQSPTHSSIQQATRPQYHQPRSEYNQTQQAQTQHQQGNQGYKFGSITKGILAKGKKSDGRSEKDGYKFGESKPQCDLETTRSI